MSDKKEKNYNWVVLALDALIGDPEIINPKPETSLIAPNLVISSKYLEKFFEIYYEVSTKGDSAKQNMAILDELMANNDKSREYQLANGTILHIMDPTKSAVKGLPKGTTGYQAIALAKSQRTNSVAVMTGSGRLAPIVRLNGIDVLAIKYEAYTGRRKLTLEDTVADNYSSAWFSNGKISAKLFAEIWPNESPLRANEFVELFWDYEQTQDSGFKNIGRFDNKKQALVPLKHLNDLPYGIQPRNPGQAMMAEALMMHPDELPIVVIPGNFGSGKTFLTLAAALGQTEGNGHEAIYDKTFIVPRDATLGLGHGFLPGELIEKVWPLIGPIIDNLGNILKIKGRDSSKEDVDHSKYREKNKGKGKDFNSTSGYDWVSEKVESYLTDSPYFEITPVIYMGGRSICDSFMIFDEFQDMERFQARALLTRIGDGSKCVIMGDPKQCNNPHLSRASNGLAFVASAFKDYDGAAVITMFPEECERSAAAKAISQIFD